MAKKIVSLFEVVDCNKLLEEKKLEFKVHLHDACGNQSFTVTPIDNSDCIGKFEEMNKVVAQFFLEKGIEIQFMENQCDFVVKG